MSKLIVSQYHLSLLNAHYTFRIIRRSQYFTKKWLLNINSIQVDVIAKEGCSPTYYPSKQPEKPAKQGLARVNTQYKIEQELT